MVIDGRPNKDGELFFRKSCHATRQIWIRSAIPFMFATFVFVMVNGITPVTLTTLVLCPIPLFAITVFVLYTRAKKDLLNVIFRFEISDELLTIFCYRPRIRLGKIKLIEESIELSKFNVPLEIGSDSTYRLEIRSATEKYFFYVHYYNRLSVSHFWSYFKPKESAIDRT